MSAPSPLESKVLVIAKEIDTAFEAYTRDFSQIATIRGWTLTLALAYTGFLISIRSTSPVTILPLGVVLLLFMYLESRERMEMSLNGDEVCKVEEIFMENDPAKFTDMIQQYEFRDMRQKKQRTSRIQRWKAQIGHIRALSIIAWYSLLFLLTAGTWVAIVYRIV